MSSAPQITSSESSISSSGTTPSSESSKEGASYQTSGSEVPTKSASSKSDPPFIQTLISTVTAPGGSASSVTLVTTAEAAPSQSSSGETTPTQPSKTEDPSATPNSASNQSFPSSYIWDAVIGGQSYHLPAAGEPASPIILDDGRKAQLSHDKIKVGETKVSQEELSQGTTAGGVAVHNQEGDAPPPKDKDHDSSGGGGLIGGFLGGLWKFGQVFLRVHGIRSHISKLRRPSSSTSSESASAMADAEPYVISSKDGTSIQVFKDFIEKLDNSKGKLWTWDVIDILCNL
ncbi:hypothetical protein GRF29_96g450185 [Pseudopithomyces chartarum]|uniref:Uncharacterized protein n=1 Tax=Pseudopithomyces chartarum TaxID=1892770 RepID=A0AAN6LVA3_9PLEO|nr:hypothetical protein GRF29_96g450185 [Pseudopithomyces chartarum]